MAKPKENEYPEFYSGYIKLNPFDDIIQNLEDSSKGMLSYLNTLKDKDLNFSYAPRKWSIAQVVQHLIDTEFMFISRVLYIVRADKPALLSMDQDEWAESTKNQNKTVKEYIEDFKRIRSLSISFLQSIHPQDYTRLGTINDLEISLRAIGFIISGHCYHHITLFTEKYSN